MFGRFKRKSRPILQEDEKWVNDKLNWIAINLFEIESKPTILPVKRFFNKTYKGTDEDVRFYLDKIAELMQIDSSEIELQFYEENKSAVIGDAILIQPEDNNGTAGLYMDSGETRVISIERSTVQDVNQIIATLVHELCHYLLGDRLWDEMEEQEEELFTDLLAVAFGFGIFLGNAKFSFSQYQSGSHFGWTTSSLGYLPIQVIAYAMAEIENRKNTDSHDWLEYLAADFRQDFLECNEYLKSKKEKN